MLTDNGEDVVAADEQVFFVVDLDFGAAVAGVHDFVADLEELGQFLLLAIRDFDVIADGNDLHPSGGVLWRCRE